MHLIRLTFSIFSVAYSPRRTYKSNSVFSANPVWTGPFPVNTLRNPLIPRTLVTRHERIQRAEIIILIGRTGHQDGEKSVREGPQRVEAPTKFLPWWGEVRVTPERAIAAYDSKTCLTLKTQLLTTQPKMRQLQSTVLQIT